MDAPLSDRLRRAVDDALATHLDAALPQVAELHSSLEPLTEELRAFVLGGGKRVRPTLLLLGFRSAGGERVADVMGAALALELLHTCALLHDDIIDAAPTRRGRPTTHRRFAELHRREGWTGDADAFGRAAAILLGDLAFVQADELFMGVDVPADRLLAGFRRFTLLREEVMAGQYVDVHAATSAATSRDLALTVASLKSGRYSVARPLEIGAILAGADRALVEGLGAVGEPLGRAFQVRDDLLGVFGQEDETGKSVASDLREGKRTLLVAETVERLDPDARAWFEDALGDPQMDAATARQLRTMMVESGGRDAAEGYLDAAVGTALDELDQLELDAEVGGALREMAAFIRDRTA